jgi:hypothetical protein
MWRESLIQLESQECCESGKKGKYWILEWISFTHVSVTNVLMYNTQWETNLIRWSKMRWAGRVARTVEKNEGGETAREI